jgi:hypothetical protein
VSAEVAEAMAKGALCCSNADIAVSVTGVTGPEPDERDNTIGLVYFACATWTSGCPGVERKFGDIGRSATRYAAASEALKLIANAAKGSGVPSHTAEAQKDVGMGIAMSRPASPKRPSPSPGQQSRLCR